jgi:hypothetical protein
MGHFPRRQSHTLEGDPMFGGSSTSISVHNIDSPRTGCNGDRIMAIVTGANPLGQIDKRHGR